MSEMHGMIKLTMTSHLHNSPLQGVVMVAHGARAAGWDAPFQTVLASVRASSSATRDATRYSLAFLEHKLPATAEAVNDLVTQGCTHITLVPMLLGIGAHARDDLPLLLSAAQAAHPQVQFHLAPTLGEDAQVLLALQAFVQAQAKA
jgi:sirohydrochlorin cobaltochelatase